MHKKDESRYGWGKQKINEAVDLLETNKHPRDIINHCYR